MMMLDKTKHFTVLHKREDKGRYLQNGMIFTLAGLPFGAEEQEPVADTAKKTGNMLTFGNHVQESAPLPGNDGDGPAAPGNDGDGPAGPGNDGDGPAGPKKPKQGPTDEERIHAKPEVKTDGKTRLCLDDARNIRRKHAEGVAKTALMKEFKTSRQSLNKILAGATLQEPNIPEHLRDKAGRDYREQATIDMLPKDE